MRTWSISGSWIRAGTLVLGCYVESSAAKYVFKGRIIP
jgi:hypothetical protein